MDAEELEEFIQARMIMSHICQPLLIRSLLDAGGTSTLRHLAIEFVKSDESQLRYYEDRIKKMPLRVLRNHGIVRSTDGVVSLAVESLTFEERARLRALCEQKEPEGTLQSPRNVPRMLPALRSPRQHLRPHRSSADPPDVWGARSALCP